MKKLNLSSHFKRNAILITIATLLTVGLLITGGYISDGYVLKVNDVSGARIKASKQIENKVATEKARVIAEESVTTRFKVDLDINSKINNNLTEFFTEVESLRKESLSFFTPQKTDGNNTVAPSLNSTDVVVGDSVGNESNQEREDLDGTILQNTTPKEPEKRGNVYDDSFILTYLSKEQAKYIVEMELESYTLLRENIESKIFDILEAGIKEETIAKTLVDLKSEFEKLYMETALSELGYDIASSYLEANLVPDEEATEKLKLEKRNEVEPIYYRTGQTIVDDGGIVTEEAYQALDSLGLISKGYRDSIIPIIGIIIFAISIIALSCEYIHCFNEKVYKNKNETMLLFVLYIVVILFVRLMYKELPYTFLPILAFVMLVAILLDSRLAIMLNISITLITLLITKGDMEMVMYFIITGTVSALVSKYANQRNNIYLIGLIISLVSTAVSFAINLLTNKVLDTETFINMSYAFLNGFLTVIICMGSLPFWEAMFGIVTTIKLLDLTNPSNELLRRLTIEAPGTYHHSLIVANLAETAAYDIKADPNIARVGAYYHDIGKLKYPQYFSENQIGENLHDYMDSYSSVQIITSHVKFGLEMAEEKKMPRVIRDIIGEHHGNTLVKYFYHKAKKENDGKDIKEEDFRYKHETPKSKEAAVVMLADTVEAAVRSMISNSKGMDEVEEFVRALIRDKVDDNQLIDSFLTIRDIDTIAISFMRVFKGMYHERIPYPKEEVVKKDEKIEENEDTEGKACS